MTWHVYIDNLTPQQIAQLGRCDANPDHLAGAEEHRRATVAVAAVGAVRTGWTELGSEQSSPFTTVAGRFGVRD